ncbi:MAG: hypothetical protein GX455_16265 [Phycisphaerae bacterium]|nr:hypothetical protein [Phycisphaerae bacterium]
MVGVNDGGSIEASYALGTVDGFSKLGGLIGVYRQGGVENCYSGTNVKGRYLYIGGLVGSHNLAWGIKNCFSYGTVVGQGGGLVGGIDSWASIQNSFWDLESSGMTTSAAGTGKTTEEMKTLSTFTSAGWDFVGEAANGTADVWRMCADGVDYPRLSWEFSQNGDLNCPDGVGLEDLVYLAGRWMASTPATVGAADVNGNGRVGIEDFVVMAENWMR